MRRLFSTVVAIVGIALLPAAAGATTTQKLKALRGQPCDIVSEFTCVAISQPLDHFDATNQKRMSVSFAVRPANKKSKGLYVVATGGPGSSGILSADSYLSSYPTAMLDHYDIVFFDQRGIGRSGNLNCPNTGLSVNAPSTEVAADAAAYVEACIRELSSTTLLPYLGTNQAVADLERFRIILGSPAIWLYGESYGTQYGQVFAAAYPSALKGLIIDGVVDLTLSGPDFWASAARGFETVLNNTLANCSKRTICTRDTGGSASDVYDALQARLMRKPIIVRFPLATGKATKRTLTIDLFNAATGGQMYSIYGRMMYQRAIAAAGQGDLVPLLRLAYANASIDPQTLAIVSDPSWSDAMYYGIDCRDYWYYNGTQSERSNAFLAAASQVASRLPRIGGAVFMSDYPCIWWPGSQPSETRPAALVNTGIPTLVIVATSDPITPVSQGRGVYSRLADGYLITTRGGSHVAFGRGNTCPDKLVLDFLTSGKLPPRRSTVCPGSIVANYIPLAPRRASDFTSMRASLVSFRQQFDYIPEYRYWDGESTQGTACTVGGSVHFKATATGATLRFDHCSFTPGVVYTGKGTENAQTGRFALRGTLTGRWNNDVRFVATDDRATVTIVG